MPTANVVSDLCREIKDADIPEIPQPGSPIRIDLIDGYFLIAKVDHDDLTADFFHELKWANNRGQRPVGFTGAAVKVAWNRGDCLWLEPERSGRTVYNDKDTISYIKRVVEDGYAFVCLALYGPCVDAFGETHTVQIASESVGGINWEPFTRNDTCPIYDALSNLKNELACSIQSKSA